MQLLEQRKCENFHELTLGGEHMIDNYPGCSTVYHFPPARTHDKFRTKMFMFLLFDKSHDRQSRGVHVKLLTSPALERSYMVADVYK